jgi:TRAP transporter TAXI family solute receptor
MSSQPSKCARLWRYAIAVGLCAGGLAVTLPACTLLVDRPDVVIGTGSPSGTDYPLGGSICRLFNLDMLRDGRRCAAILSAGPIANIESLRDGRADIGIVQSDLLADAMAGQGPFAFRGPDSELRVLFAGYANAFTIVARRELGIRSAAELRGKRINMGSPGSGERISMTRIMAALGVTGDDFAEVHELSLSEQHRALCARELDIIVYSVGHPNG